MQTHSISYTQIFKHQGSIHNRNEEYMYMVRLSLKTINSPLCKLQLLEKLSCFSVFQNSLFHMDQTDWTRVGLSMLKTNPPPKDLWSFDSGPPCVHCGIFEKVLVAPKDITQDGSYDTSRSLMYLVTVSFAGLKSSFLVLLRVASNNCCRPFHSITSEGGLDILVGLPGLCGQKMKGTPVLLANCRHLCWPKC